MLDIHDLMRGLAKKRPIFHSEKDFQFALAWHIREEFRQPVRLEWKPFPDEPSVVVENEYWRLGEHLASLPAKPWTATFAELEGIVGESLQREAKAAQEWWGNCWYQPQGRAWLAAGWRVIKVDFAAKTVRFRPARMYVDLWLPQIGLAIELKYGTKGLGYKTSAMHRDLPCESFSLADQGAENLGRYDFLMDVQRLEQVSVGRRDVDRGIAVLLTNDPLYWKCPKRNTIDREFRIHERRELPRRPNEMRWIGTAKPGQERECAIMLNGSYRIGWRDYSGVDGDANYGAFRYLALEVSRETAGAPDAESANEADCSPSP